MSKMKDVTKAQAQQGAAAAAGFGIGAMAYPTVVATLAAGPAAPAVAITGVIAVGTAVLSTLVVTGINAAQDYFFSHSDASPLIGETDHSAVTDVTYDSK